MPRFTALLDACSLVPVSLADTLLRLAEAGLYRPLWSERILTEMVAAIGHVHPHLVEQAARRSATMQRHFVDATVHGWEGLLEAIELPDPQDRHVVAAAIVGRADVIVTANLKDFPAAAMEPFGIEVQSPDAFLLNQLDLDPQLVVSTLSDQAADTRRPPLTVPDLLQRLAAAGTPGFAQEATGQLWRIPPARN